MHIKPRFHRIHGTAVVLSEDQTVATRKEHFCNGIAFSSQPVKINEKLCIEVSHRSEWSGAIRIGLTSNDPAKLNPASLPRYVCPDLTNKPGYWARGVSEQYAKNGNHITFYINEEGQLHYFVNNEHRGVLLNALPTNIPLWVVFDIYGNTDSVKFITPDETPVEIIARGPDAMQAFQKASESGTQPLFRTRLMLLGRDGVGKTSLKKALIGQRHDTSEQSTDGIDLSASCSFNLRDRKSWQLAIKGGKEELEQGGEKAHDLEEEYYQALATNIVQELLYKKKQREKDSNEKAGQSDNKRNNKLRPESRGERRKSKNSGPASSGNSPGTGGGDFSLQEELLKEMPERVVQLVQEKWKEKQTNQSTAPTANTPSTAGKNIILNIWDFAGQAVYYTTHQVFLSSRAVYVIVFNLCLDLDAPAKMVVEGEEEQSQGAENELSNLDYMDFWMSSIHAHAAQNTRNSVDNMTLSPPILIVGTHRDSLSDNPEERQKLVEEKFKRIREILMNKSYQRHVVNLTFAVENNLPEGQKDEQLIQLRQYIEEVASREPYMGEQMPIKWLKFEQLVEKLVEQGTNFVTLEQIREVASDAGITSDSELKTVLEFHHDLGVIIYYGEMATLDNTLRNTVILKPQWLIDMFKRVITVVEKKEQWGVYVDSWNRLEHDGVLEGRLIDHMWKDYLDQKPALLGLMEKFDLICPCLPPKHQSQENSTNPPEVYYVPSLLKKCPIGSDNLFTVKEKDVVFYLDFNGFLPDGLFHRLLTRASRWCQECGGIMPKLYYRKARFYLDSEHDFLLEMEPMLVARIKVCVLRVAELEDSDVSSLGTQGEKALPAPDITATAKVRNFLDSSLSDLREMWMKRISYKAVVECHCEKKQKVQHFLNLDECLSNKIVCCDHRRIKTNQYRKWFPSPTRIVKEGPILPESITEEGGLTYIHNLEVQKGSELPSWVKGAAKLLNGGSEGRDWTALAKRLGYKKNKIEMFNNDLNPALSLLTDWIISSGNTALSVDMLVTYLEQMHCDDVVDIILKGQEADVDPPQIFISYQWDIQDEVKLMRDRLEKSGYHCWMDIGQMGGGDQLNAKIDEGIRSAKVIIACVTPKYIVSHLCNRELSLGDVLRKPIIPVMFDKVPWPPPGGMALMFSQLVYINMKEVGGHGGSGVHADLEDRYSEIIQQVSRFSTPVLPKVRASSVKTNSDKSHNSQSTVGSESHFSLTPEPPLIQEYYVGNRRASLQVPALRNDENAEPMTRHRNTVEQVHVHKCAVCVIL